MLAKAKREILHLQCPKCDRWLPGRMNDKMAHFIGYCRYCNISIAFGVEQDIENKQFILKSVSDPIMYKSGETKKEYMIRYWLDNRQKINWRRQNNYAKKFGVVYPIETTCAICGKLIAGGMIKLDHEHQRNIFRGWLCNGCNRGLGFFNDSSTLLDRAARYLKGTSESL